MLHVFEMMCVCVYKSMTKMCECVRVDVECLCATAYVYLYNKRAIITKKDLDAKIVILSALVQKLWSKMACSIVQVAQPV